jgi:hypothetical protein
MYYTPFSRYWEAPGNLKNFSKAFFFCSDIENETETESCVRWASMISDSGGTGLTIQNADRVPPHPSEKRAG